MAQGEVNHGDTEPSASMEEIAYQVEFLAAIQEGVHQLDRGEGIPHEEIKKQFASWFVG